MKLSINQMRAVEAVVRTGSFSAAAKELGISQPSVSNHISALERYFQTQLIHRNGRNAEPSEVCREILSRIRSVLAITNEVETCLEGHRQLQTGSLKLGYSTFQFAIPILSAYMNQYSDVDIEARAMASHDLIPLLEDGKFDVAFVTASQEPQKFHSVHICTQDVVLVLPKDHPLLEKKSATWDDIVGCSLVQRENSSETRRAFERAAQKAGVQLKTVLALGSWGSIVSTVHSGMGIGVAMAGEVTPSDNLSMLPIDDPALSVSHYLICLEEMRNVATISAMFNIAEPFCQ